MAKHKEAFALMWYACEKCRHRERIWNSRDGVTPFGCQCPSCGETMYHVDWHLDEANPSHKPRRWQRFFRDGTPEEAERIMRRRIEMLRDRFPVTPEREATLIAGARDGSSGEFQPGWPMIDVQQ